MLILTRKKQEGLYIGRAYVKVLDTDPKSGKVRIGIEAPDDVAIRREELPERESDRKGDV
jgi:carbon storage regulator CsrA